ncbi:phosphatase PAP2 family protein [Methylocapsa sp. S129]|uniref:phosphatase PAP2 family protein n=1 Tax=Methylocapsa sp. S129 TaxID=1641869 RepID=UPI00131C66B4|nr:phosphatase PAP2 family protein [Methylocapsa sp. S129]
MSHIGGLGHSAILFPASLALFGFLLWLGRRADALAFVAALTVCLVATLVAKLAFHACESNVAAFGVESPSGHASFSAVFYGCAALVIAGGRPPWARMGVYAVAALFVFLIGVSRVVVGAHTFPDVVVGLGIGMISILVFHALRGPPRPLAISLRAVAWGIPTGAVLLTIILYFARRWTAEPLIEAVALRLNLLLNLCGPVS